MRSRPMVHPKKSPGGRGFQGGRMRQASWLFAVLFFALSSASYGVELKPKVTIAAFALYGDQSVFESEAKGAARIVADRFGGSPVIVRATPRAATMQMRRRSQPHCSRPPRSWTVKTTSCS